MQWRVCATWLEFLKPPSVCNHGWHVAATSIAQFFPGGRRAAFFAVGGARKENSWWTCIPYQQKSKLLNGKDALGALLFELLNKWAWGKFPLCKCKRFPKLLNCLVWNGPRMMSFLLWACMEKMPVSDMPFDWECGLNLSSLWIQRCSLTPTLSLRWTLFLLDWHPWWIFGWIGLCYFSYRRASSLPFHLFSIAMGPNSWKRIAWSPSAWVAFSNWQHVWNQCGFWCWPKRSTAEGQGWNWLVWGPQPIATCAAPTKRIALGLILENFPISRKSTPADHGDCMVQPKLSLGLAPCCGSWCGSSKAWKYVLRPCLLPASQIAQGEHWLFGWQGHDFQGKKWIPPKAHQGLPRDEAPQT